ncbi:MAG TPA: DUF4845 domain-containing protein [Nevskiaceae bacterium]|nr:DUF4845 domain-containing protein [Nevskiaceae bacterium]
MKGIGRQKGIGLFGFLALMFLIGFFALVTMKVLPLYLNQMKVSRAVHQVAQDPDNADKDQRYLYDRLQRRWDVEDTKILDVKDVNIVKLKDGRRALTYDYDARVNLFYNVYVVVNFKSEEPMRVVTN